MADSQKKSANVFNVTDYTNLSVSRNGGAENLTKTADTISFDSGTSAYSGFYINNFTNAIDNYDSSQQYYISAVVNTDTALNLRWANNDNVVALSVGSNSVVYHGTVSGFICYTISTQAHIVVSKIMICTIQHQYEPYGWLHSLRKLTTATEAVENPLYSDGTAITSYTLKGNTTQSGTPSPQNPVMPNGVGELSDNLFNGTIEQGSFNADGSETPWSDITTRVRSTFFNKLSSGTYTINCVGADDVVVYVYETNDTSSFVAGESVVSWQSLPYALTLTANRFVRFAFRKSSNSDIVPTDVSNVMLNVGLTPKPYEPYGYKIPISSGGVTTNIYLGSTQTVRAIKKLVLTGEENWGEGSCSVGYRFNITITSAMPSDTTIGVRSMCTHQQLTATGNTYNTLGTYTITGTSELIMTLNGDTRLASWKSWLAAQYANGTPVTVWYVLTTAETAAVNEPLMKIGTYADTLSNATAIPTTEGANSISVDTTVQPSEFTATWTGWHNASVKEKSENYLDENDFGLVEVAAGTYRVGTDVGVLPSGKYTFNAVKSSSAVQIYRTTKNGSTYNYETITNMPYTFTADGVSNQIFRSAGNTGSSWADLGYTNVMLNTGETAQTYEPYWK